MQTTSARPPIVGVTGEYYQVNKRHTLSALRRMNPKGLRKQNFIEDGQSIIGSQKQVVGVKVKQNLSP